jgi:tRNA (guanine26-N2/guanine27-N2)-dimethyltransferase
MILRIMELIEAVEGRTRFFIPGQDKDSAFPPGTAPVFYNRRMEINRDATVLLLQVVHPEDYIDTMGATGIRGLRIAQECGIPVTINDRDARAVDLIRRNILHSGLENVTVTKSDVNVLLSGQRFDAVDLDPFGTPAPFIDSAIRSTRRFLMVTATDTAPLCGAHKKAGMRRYFAQPLNNEYHSETGLRTLLGFVVREALKYDMGLVPQFCFAHEHFVRLHLQVRRGASAAERTLSSIGYIMQCPKCPSRSEQQGMLPQPAMCEYCRVPLIPVGPLWLGGIQSDTLLDSMAEMVPLFPLGTSRELVTLLTLCRNELPTAGFYDYHQLAKRERRSPPPMEELLGRIHAMGFPATRCHYLGTGVKTTAPLHLLLEAVKGDC